MKIYFKPKNVHMVVNWVPKGDDQINLDLRVPKNGTQLTRIIKYYKSEIITDL